MFKKADLDQAITTINSKNTQKDPVVIKYDSKGRGDTFSNKKLSDENTVAVEVTNLKSGPLYKVRQHNGKFYNPSLEGSTFDYSLNRMDKETGALKFQLRSVSEKAFKLYIQFLERGYDSLLIAAERA